jgi:ATP-binding cassette subfamily B (MDR/TAP) protein 1
VLWFLLFIATCAVGYVIAFIYNWRMALLVTGLAPLVAVGGYFQMQLMMSLGGSSDKLYSTANQAVAEAVSSIRVIQVRCGGCGAALSTKLDLSSD